MNVEVQDALKVITDIGLVDTQTEETLDGLPYTTIIYGNGPGALSARVELLTVDTSKFNN